MASSEFTGLIPYAINFAIVFGAAAYYGRKPLAKYVYQRHERQKDLIGAAAQLKKDAEKRFIAIQDSLKKLNDEGAKILDEINKETNQEIKAISERADADVTRLKKDVARIISNEEEQQTNKARRQILEQAVKLTEERLRKGMKTEDHSAIIKVAKKTIEVEITNG